MPPTAVSKLSTIISLPPVLSARCSRLSSSLSPVSTLLSLLHSLFSLLPPLLSLPFSLSSLLSPLSSLLCSATRTHAYRGMQSSSLLLSRTPPHRAAPSLRSHGRGKLGASRGASSVITMSIIMSLRTTRTSRQAWRLVVSTALQSTGAHTCDIVPTPQGQAQCGHAALTLHIAQHMQCTYATGNTALVRGAWPLPHH